MGTARRLSIDKQGMIRYRHIGARACEKSESTIRRLLAEK